jgi:2-polyprenyl-3-methyl-5-hydroxy-6-metoxy-1,4-benzoquinol methylase/DNA-directed RNA polymerase subunit RPC12/RpoP
MEVTVSFSCIACLRDVPADKPLGKSIIFAHSAYYRCPTCGTRQAHPLPSTAELDDLYRDSYITKHWEQMKGWKQGPLDQALKRLRVLSERARAVSLITEVQRLGWSPHMRVTAVDCGAGHGTLTRLLRERLPQNSRLIAIDAAKEVTQLKGVADEAWCLSENGLAARLADGAGSGFDLIFFSHTLEHLREPELILRAFARRLAPDGLLVVEFPHGLHPSYNLKGDLALPDLFFFTAAGMKAMAKRAGCRPLTTRGISPGPDWLLRRNSKYAQYLAALFFILRAWLTNDGNFHADPAFWYRMVFTNSPS